MATVTKESTKQRILDAAGPIFARKGYRLATIREISDAAGANVAAVNYHFGDKRQLYADVINAVRTQRDREFPIPHWSAETCPRQKLYDFVFTLLNRIAASQNAPWQVQLISREVLDPSEACEELVIEYFRPVFEKLLSIIDELYRQYCMVPNDRSEYRGLTSAQRLKVGYSVVGQCLFYRHASEVTARLTPAELKGELSIEQLAQHISNITTTGIVGFSQQTATEQFHRQRHPQN